MRGLGRQRRTRGALTEALQVLAAVLLATALAAQDAEPSPLPEAAPVREMRLVMGTTAEVWAAGVPAQALAAAFAELARVDASMSLWQPESELSLLNRGGEAVVSPLLFETLRRALEVAEASSGAFDPTVEPLLRARGAYDGRADALDAAPARRLLERVGFRRVTLDADTRRVRLLPGTALDLGGIAKGHAADLALRVLRQAGATRALVDLGASSQCVFGDPLTLELADPAEAERPNWGRITLRDACLSSSGTAQRGAHILDPRSGRVAKAVLGATVVAVDGAEADALSTALFVLGPEAGLRLVARRGAQGFVLLRERGRATLRATPGFVERHELETAPWLRVREDDAR